MEVRSICPYCGVGCGVLIDVHRGAVRSVRGDPGHPTNRGGLCAKGRRLAEAVSPGDRLLYPMSRSSQAEPFRRLSWSQAVERLASAIRRARDEHGPEAVALYLSGQLLTEDYYVANKLGKGLIGTPNVDTNSRLCMSSTVAAYKRAFGADGPPGCYEDLEQARDVFLFGSNAADTHPILFGRLLAARGRLNAHWTVVDPRRTPTAKGADDHLQLRPGSDVALLLGMTQTLFEEELVDEARVRRTCVGLDELRTAASAMPAERAATLCELPASRIRSAARRLAASPAALSLWCQGLNQSSAGTDKVNALINLHLLTGQIGRPGTGPLSLTGQANAMGGREVGALATELAAHRGWDDPGRAEVEAAWRLGSLPSPQMGRGLTAVELVEAMLERRVRVLWVACSNPLASLPDGAAVREALRRLDLLVVQELYHPTDTGSLAHLLLPAAGWSEKTGTSTSSERRVGLARQAVDPPGEALPDWRIFAAVGSALGAPEAFGWEGPDQVFDEHVALTAGRDLDMSALSHRLLERDGPQLWPYPAGGTSQARRYVDGRYPTPGGRARLVAVAHREPSEAPSDAYPLRLTTGRDRDRWHTLTRTGRIAALRGGQSPVLSIHPSDAEVSGLADGEDAVISSPRGALRARVSVDGRQRPGTAYLPFHEGPLVAPDGWPNLLTERALDPLSFQPELKHATVRVGPARRAVALAGGPLAQAVGKELRNAG
ncbi:MAG: nitrate reductase, partial [Candidatus Dormibacteraeota bacterium]|nr:nitrate reductase [Candidatus Dormibacteraeota bacterium]